MKILCLCPTYGRPRLVANALACFLAQDYPADLCKLLILDDAGQLPPTKGTNWEVIATDKRFESLPAKYNAMLKHENVLENPFWHAVAPWDDDDIYLPWHLAAARAALLAGAASAKPSMVWSLYGSKIPKIEEASGRFYASMVFSVRRLVELGGWINTKQADFDQQMIGAAAPATDMLDHSPGRKPSFVFRWGSTKSPHAQSFIRGPKDTTWYERFPVADSARVNDFGSIADAETTEVCRLLTELQGVPLT